MYRAAERDKREKVSIGSQKTVMVAERECARSERSLGNRKYSMPSV